jgi:hypothetical protein
VAQGRSNGSRCIIAVEYLILGNTSEYTWGPATASPGGAGASQAHHRDCRLALDASTEPAAVTRAGIDTTASLQGGIMTGPAIIPVDYILPANWHFVVRAAANTAARITITWRERPCAEAELGLR